MESYLNRSDGKKLFYRVQGEGEPLVLVHGVMVDADFFDITAELLSRQYRVISYDRRGYSRSEKADNYDVEAQSDDLKDVIEQVAGGHAIVVGCSAGALISVYFTQKHPEMVDYLIVHEPPMVCFEDAIDEGEAEWFRGIEELRANGKYRGALMSFLSELAIRDMDERVRPYSPQQIDNQLNNGRVFMKHEFDGEFKLGKEAYDFDGLKKFNRISCLCRDANSPVYTVRATKALAKALGKEVIYCPGSHNAAHDLPYEFSSIVMGILKLEVISNE